jgi:hypothetical protein
MGSMETLKGAFVDHIIDLSVKSVPFKLNPLLLE